ncbi:MAG: hypothetical protein WC814_02225 [Candidatus Paceibacterota bacterium]|jgi:hypothetical protein
MTHSGFVSKVALLTLVLCIAASTPVFSTEELSLIRSEVTKRDSRGRVEVMEVHTASGKCVAQIAYEGIPRVYILVLSRTRLQNLGYLQINDGTEDGLSDTILVRIFNKAIREYCLPLIVQGYVIL